MKEGFRQILDQKTDPDQFKTFINHKITLTTS
jgi:hypothetical protein